jgi:hypothetical protein
MSTISWGGIRYPSWAVSAGALAAARAIKAGA